MTKVNADQATWFSSDPQSQSKSCDCCDDSPRDFLGLVQTSIRQSVPPPTAFTDCDYFASVDHLFQPIIDSSVKAACLSQAARDLPAGDGVVAAKCLLAEQYQHDLVIRRLHTHSKGYD